ncbi:interleukin-18 receptor 1 [Rhynchocyon petersi]
MDCAGPKGMGQRVKHPGGCKVRFSSRASSPPQSRLSRKSQAVEETCKSLPHYNAVAGEPFYWQYCLPSPNPKNENETIIWYKSNRTLGQVELNSSSSPRIAFRDYTLEFWPVELEDSGCYIFKMGNDEHKWELNVTTRNEHSCFTEKQVTSKVKKVNKSLKIECINTYYKKRIERTSLYKNCEKIRETNDSTYTFQKNAEFEDQGYYTCVFFLHYNGKPFNLTKTYNIKVIEEALSAFSEDLKRIVLCPCLKLMFVDMPIHVSNSYINPVLYGPKFNRYAVELGQDVALNCSALLNKDDLIYWNFLSESGTAEPNIREDNETKFMTPDGKWYASKILHIKKVNEKNLHFPYNCTVASQSVVDPLVFILVRKDNVDIPGHVFTRGITITVVMLVAVVCIVTACAIYRVDLTLFYRHLTGRDETLTDGKTYDAFVSYLKEYQPEHCEEHTFAVEILPKVLEKHFGYKLCIFERDVMPGGAVVDEIHSLIEKSRRLIIVLSENYMSNKVRYELESGLHEALVERKIKIILIEFTPISDFMFLPKSLELLKSHRVLKWKADKSLSYNSRFWKNLRYLMPAKMIQEGKDEYEILPVLSHT